MLSIAGNIHWQKVCIWQSLSGCPAPPDSGKSKLVDCGFLSWLPSSRAKNSLKPIVYAELLNFFWRSYLVFFICHERPLCRRSKWIQALIPLQGEKTKLFSLTFHWKRVVLLSISPLNTVLVVDVDHTLPPGPVSGSLGQLDSASDRLETSPTVSDHTVLTIVVANYWSFRVCLWPPIVHYRPRPMP